MTEFNRSKLEEFLGVVRKYMQMRGSLSQKDLAEITGVGVSTMSRFLSMKTADINPQLVAKICAKLEIPLHEVIDFVEESFSDQFMRLVKFYKGDDSPGAVSAPQENDVQPSMTASQQTPSGSLEDALIDTLSSGTAQKNATAKVKVGNNTRNIPFTADQGGKNSELSVRDKLSQLTPRQKAYVSDFLSLDIEARDLIVDLGNDLFRYFRQKGMIN